MTDKIKSFFIIFLIFSLFNQPLMHGQVFLAPPAGVYDFNLGEPAEGAIPLAIRDPRIFDDPFGFYNIRLETYEGIGDEGNYGFRPTRTRARIKILDTILISRLSRVWVGFGGDVDTFSADNVRDFIVRPDGTLIIFFPYSGNDKGSINIPGRFGRIFDRIIVNGGGLAIIKPYGGVFVTDDPLDAREQLIEEKHKTGVFWAEGWFYQGEASQPQATISDLSGRYKIFIDYKKSEGRIQKDAWVSVVDGELKEKLLTGAQPLFINEGTLIVRNFNTIIIGTEGTLAIELKSGGYVEGVEKLTQANGAIIKRGSYDVVIIRTSGRMDVIKYQSSIRNPPTIKDPSASAL